MDPVRTPGNSNQWHWQCGGNICDEQLSNVSNEQGEYARYRNESGMCHTYAYKSNFKKGVRIDL